MAEANRIGLTKEEQLAINEYLVRKGLPTEYHVTFSDVALPERYSTVRSRSEIDDFRATLAGSVELGIPIVSANMESVTGAEMAIALAREGGLGFIPQMLPLEDRLEIIERVRRADSAFVDDPLTITPEKTLKEAKELMERYGIYGLVVVEKGKPIGILSTRDWRYEADETKLVRDLMGGKENLIFARKNVPLEEAKRLLRVHRIEKLPLVNGGGKLIGLLTAHGLFYKMRNPRALRDGNGRFLVAGSIGVGRTFGKQQLTEIEAQVEKGIGVLLIDTARANSINVEEALPEIKKNFPSLAVVAGNVCTPEGAKFLFELGADAVKVNQGRGEVCTTTRVGIGLPQLTTIAACSVIAQRYGKRLVADGGMKGSDDMIKALAAGADVLMTGYLLAGTEESAATAYLNNSGLIVKNYEGSASFQAQAKRVAKGTLDKLRRPEGRTREVPVTGKVADRIRDILDSFRSAMSYLGVRTLDELRRDTTFKLQTNAGLFEGTKKSST